MIRIIDNKKIDMTDDEWSMYNQICVSYDRPSFKGIELFRELFETDDYGIIVFIKPPSNRHTSMEVFLFISVVMLHQHIRLVEQRADEQMKEMSQKVDKLCEELKERFNALVEKK